MSVFLLILKIIGIVLLSVIALVIIVLCIPFYLYISSQDKELTVSVRALFVKVRVSPLDEDSPIVKLIRFIGGLGKKGDEKEESEEQEEKKNVLSSLGDRGLGGMLGLIWKVVKIALGTFGRCLKGATVCRLDAQLYVSGEDAADAAVRYGKFCAVLYPVLALLLTKVKRYKKNIYITPDFTAKEDRLILDVVMRIAPIAVVGRILAALFGFLVDTIKEKVQIATAQMMNAENTGR